MKAYVLVGISRRLPGKHFIEVAPGKRLIDIVVDNLLSIGLDVVVYSRIPFEAEVPVIIDKSSWILESVISLINEEPFFLFGGDMPTVKKEAVEMMLSEFNGKSLVPRWPDTGYLEPLHAIYSLSVLPCLQGAKSITSGLSSCEAMEFIDAFILPEETFFNVNTPLDMERLRRIILSL